MDDAGSVVELDFYGLTVRIDDSGHAVSKALRLDFAWFVAPTGSPDFEISISEGPLDLDSFSGAPAISIAPRRVVYRWEGLLVTDVAGKAIVVHDPEAAWMRVSYMDASIAYEYVYAFLYKKVMAYIETIGLMRLHALTVVGRDGAVAVMLPSGGGKTTLARKVLEESDFKLLSEDAPLVARNGMVHPFPLRIGLDASDASSEVAGGLRRIELTEARPKVAIEIDSFRDRISDQAEPLRHLVIGRRMLGDRASLEEVMARHAAGLLFRENVVGAGLYQGLRFLHQEGRTATWRKLRRIARKSRCSASILRRARVWHLDLGTNHDRNWAALRALLDDSR